jgi:glycosyltransferase involved in cell wall biosynthesis
MRKRNNFTCIIPFYNEGKRIIPVLRVVAKIDLITQIICSDDGSTDGAGRLVKRIFSRLTLIRSNKNKGKAEAVFRALRYIKNENILLLDADLQGLKAGEIRRALKKFQEYQFIDMIILENRSQYTLTDRLSRATIFLSGKRILRKKDLKEVRRLRPKGYQLEVSLNKYMADKKKMVFWMKSKSLNPHKMKKIGLVEGMEKQTKMGMDIIDYVGLPGYLKQVFLFGRKRLK